MADDVPTDDVPTDEDRIRAEPGFDTERDTLGACAMTVWMLATVVGVVLAVVGSGWLRFVGMIVVSPMAAAITVFVIVPAVYMWTRFVMAAVWREVRMCCGADEVRSDPDFARGREALQSYGVMVWSTVTLAGVFSILHGVYHDDRFTVPGVAMVTPGVVYLIWFAARETVPMTGVLTRAMCREVRLWRARLCPPAMQIIPVTDFLSSNSTDGGHGVDHCVDYRCVSRSWCSSV
jgi:hypothetical protein